MAHEYRISDAGGVALLAVAEAQLARALAARQLLDKVGVVVLDRFGNPRMHPAAGIERDAYAGFRASLKALNLDVVKHDAIGRPTVTATSITGLFSTATSSRRAHEHEAS